MTRRHWWPRPGDAELIRRHLERQLGVDPRFVRLDDNRIARVGELSEGEGHDRDC